MCKQPISQSPWWRRSSSLLVALAVVGGAEAQYLRRMPGKTGNEVDPYNHSVVQSEKYFLEVGSKQVGGIVDGRLVMNGWAGGKGVGVLRCPSGQAMVGLRTRVGSVVDYMQVYCVKPVWTGRFWTWDTALPGPGVGNPQGGDWDHIQNCGSGYMVAGYRAFTRENGKYLRDVRIDCGRIRSGPTLPMDISPWPKDFQVFPKEEESRGANNNFSRQTSQRQGRVPNRRWAERQDRTGQIVPIQITGYDDRQPEFYCDEGGATGISYALGRWALGSTVVQAFNMLCVGSYLEGEAPKKGFF